MGRCPPGHVRSVFDMRLGGGFPDELMLAELLPYLGRRIVVTKVVVVVTKIVEILVT